MKEKIILIFLLILVLPIVSAQGNIVKQDDPYDVRITVAANGSISTVLVNITINDPDGIIIVPFQVMQKNTASQDFNYTLPGSNTSKIGLYDCTFYAFSSIADNEAFSCSFEVNPSGKEYIPIISAGLMLGGILTLMFISSLLLVIGWKIDLFPMKVFLIILSGVVAIMNIGFVAGSFQEFFSNESALTGAFGTLYIIFIMLITAFSVFLILWIVITGFKLYKIRRGFYVQE